MPGVIRVDQLAQRLGSAPATPPAGQAYWYTKTDRLPYFLDETGTEYAFQLEGVPQSDKLLDDDDADAWRVREGTNDYLVFTTSNGSELMQVGSATVTALRLELYSGTGGTRSVTTGVHHIDAVGNVEINSSAEILLGNDNVDQDIGIGTGGDRTVTVGKVATSAVVADTSTGDLSLLSSDNGLWTIADNKVAAWKVAEGANAYFAVSTVNTSEVVSFGNTTTNPAFNFLGSGATTFSGSVDVDGVLSVTDGGSYSQVGGGFAYNAPTDDFSVTCSQFIVDSAVADAAAVRLYASHADGGIDIDAGTAGIAVDSTGAIVFTGPDNTVDFFVIRQGLNKYVSTTSTNGAEEVNIHKKAKCLGDVEITGSATTKDGIIGGTDLKIGGRAFSNVAESNTVTDEAAETDFDQQYTVPANTLKPGRALRIHAAVGDILVKDGGDTLELKVYLNGHLLTTRSETISNDLAVGIFELRCLIYGAGTDSSRTAIVSGSSCLGDRGDLGGPGATMGAEYKSLAGVDTTAAMVVKVSADWGTAHTDNAASLNALIVHTE